MKLVQPTRVSLIKRAQRIKTEIEMIFNDTAHWNSLHRDQVPIDPDPDGKMKALWDSLDEMLTKEERRGS